MMSAQLMPAMMTRCPWDGVLMILETTCSCRSMQPEFTEGCPKKIGAMQGGTPLPADGGNLADNDVQ